MPGAWWRFLTGQLRAWQLSPGTSHERFQRGHWMTKKITHLSRAPLFLRFLRLAFRIKLAALGDRCLN